MKVFFMTLLGLIVLPIFWVLQKLGITRPPATLSPVFESLSGHLFRSGISVVGEMQPIPLNHVKEVALLRLGFTPSKLHVVTVTSSETEELARQVESEFEGAPQYTGVRRNGKLVMACTFNPPDAQLEQAFGEAFVSFQPEAAGSGN